MRIVSVEHHGRSTWGVVKEGGVVDLGSRLGKSINEALARDITAPAVGPDFGLDEVKYLPPIPNPGKIVCIGVNYGDRNAEYKDNSSKPKFPSVFMRTRESLTGHLQPILLPPESEQLDYEGEIAIVIGKAGRRISQEAATSYIAGLTAMNEGSVRDWMRHGKFNVTQGKNFASSGSIGPWIATADEFENFSKLTVTTKVNDEQRQHDRTDNLLFPFAYLISYLSVFMPLAVGDVIATGTPTGSGARLTPPQFLQDGDVVEVDVNGVLCLRNAVASERL